MNNIVSCSSAYIHSFFSLWLKNAYPKGFDQSTSLAILHNFNLQLNECLIKTTKLSINQ